ncbi:hypothetical protein OQH60_08435, partial [Campylobacter sp. MIT 21-1685]|nr:hypothetical protein [Campylobacter sp. MIT 21-1684]MCX2752167.1 hypothetical protein [Campylobacter sp. MIT 21-1682]MCX2808360.1 hypothetical protein [Campylobacter sp. MIT 21-1685]
LGGHLAQAFCFFHTTQSLHKLYTFNAPGFAGALASVLTIFLRVIRILVKLLLRSVEKLLNAFGFTRRIIDKSIKTCNESLENCIEYTHTLKKEIGEEEIEALALKAKKLSKAHTSIEVHHIETIQNPLPTEESFLREWKQSSESSLSVISDLGYKYGLNIQDKFDYKNTQRLHLLYIGGLETSYIKTSHFLESILQIAYFYHYLVQSNHSFNQSIEEALDYLNAYSKKLMYLICNNRLSKEVNKRLTNSLTEENYLSIFQKEILHIFTHNPKKMAQEYQYDFNGKSETIHTESLKKEEVNKKNIMDTFLLFLSLGIFTKIIERNDMQELPKEVSMNQYRMLYKALPFCIEDKDKQELLEKENLYKTYTYKSHFATTALAKNNEEFFKAKQKQAINLLYDEQCTSRYLRETQKRGIHFNSMASTLYADTQTKELFLFANDKDYIDCNTIYEYIKQELKLQESLEELQSYTPSLFLD